MIAVWNIISYTPVELEGGNRDGKNEAQVI
jgi:hypothetical protein